MDAFFATGRAADLLLLVLLLEALALGLLWRLRRIGLPPGESAGFLVSGALLVLALRGALTGAPWWQVALPLAGAGAAHVLDLARRWRG